MIVFFEFIRYNVYRKVGECYEKILGCIRKADRDFSLIEDGDKIAVGVSGGKDSMALLYALHLYQKFAPVKFELVGITLKLGFPGMDFNPVVEFCEKHGIEYHLVDTEVYEILKLNGTPDGKDSLFIML